MIRLMQHDITIQVCDTSKSDLAPLLYYDRSAMAICTMLYNRVDFRILLRGGNIWCQNFRGGHVQGGASQFSRGVGGEINP